MIAAAVVFWCAVCTLGYVFVGYPLILVIVERFGRKRLEFSAPTQPTVSLIVSAYNEEKVIGEKIENCLSLEYPQDKLEIIVVSDASTDQTDAIVTRYAHEGVVLKRMAVRRGKTTGLNAVVPLTQGDIIVFSDANALYAPDAVQKLVRNFADPSVGCVTGDSRYIQLDMSYVGGGEDTYWDYERLLKSKESSLGSMVGGDGAIFAIRKQLFCSLREEDINDFVIPLQIVSQGYRCIFEPEAVCFENSMVHFEEEFRRKVRVVNRSWNGLFRVKQLLNPCRYGWFSIQLMSHKLLRWLTPLFLLAALTSSGFLIWQHWIYFGAVASQVCFYALGMVGLVLERLRIRSRWLSFPCYFVLMSAASIVGILKYMRGEKINIWEPEREGQCQIAKREDRAIRWACLLTSGGLLLAAIGLWPGLLFWIAWGMMLYTYIGYPVLCALLSGFLSQSWRREDCQPTVTLLIVAHNEEEILAAKIENSLVLDYPRSKLIIAVASDGSTDGTNAILRKYERKDIRAYYFPERHGKMATINRIFSELQTEIVVLSDANVIYALDAIKKLVRNFADDGVGAVSGKVTLISDQPVLSIPERLYYRYEWLIKRLESQTGSLIGVDGAMYGIRRELFQPLPDCVVLDDFVISMNIAKRGKRVVYEPEAKAQEASAASLAVELQRRSRIAAGAVQSLLQGEGLPGLSQPLLLFKYLSHKVLRWSTPVFLLMLLLANLFLLGEFVYNVTFGGQVAFYLAACIGKLQRSPASIFAVPLYICGTNLAAAYGLVRGILNQQKGPWDRLERASWAL